MGRWMERGHSSRAGVAVAVAALAAALLGPAVNAADPDGATVRVIVSYGHAPGAADRGAIKALGGTVHHVYTLIDGIAADVPAKAVAALRRNPNVESVEVDAVVRATEPVVGTQATGDFEYDNAWGVVHIGAKSAHDAGIWGQGVKVAVIDTGIDYVHDQPASLEPPVVDPEFLGNYAGGYDFVNHEAYPM